MKTDTDLLDTLEELTEKLDGGLTLLLVLHEAMASQCFPPAYYSEAARSLWDYLTGITDNLRNSIDSARQKQKAARNPPALPLRR